MRVSYKRDKKLNWLLMYLARNYCDSDNSSASPGGCFRAGFWIATASKVCVESLCNLGGSGRIIASADVTETENTGCRAPDCGSGGSGFETHQPPHFLLLDLCVAAGGCALLDILHVPVITN